MVFGMVAGHRHAVPVSLCVFQNVLRCDGAHIWGYVWQFQDCEIPTQKHPTLGITILTIQVLHDVKLCQWISGPQISKDFCWLHP